MARYRGPVVDTHVHLQLDEEMGMPAMPPHRPEQYLAVARGLDVAAAAVLVMARQDAAERTRVMNDLALELPSDGVRWLPLCSVHPYDTQFAAEEIDRVAEAGAKGFKLHPNTQRFDLGDARVTETVRRIARHGLPVLFDGYAPSDPAQPGKFLDLSTTVPEARIIIAHALGPRFGELMVYDVMGRYPGLWNRNIWVDLSFSAAFYAGSPYREQFSWSVRQLGIDRLLLGSDFPIDTPDTALAALETLGFTEDEQRAIAHDNAAELFGLD